MIHQNVQAHRSVGVNVGMINIRNERAFRRSKWIVFGKLDVEIEDSSSKDSLLGSHDGGVPVK